MSDDLWFTRLTLKRASSEIAPLIDTLAPKDGGEAMATTHRLMWSVMPQAVQRRWDRAAPDSPEGAPFLWREQERGRRYYLLGPRPMENSPFFEIESKPYSLDLSPGDRLAFDLRVHATVDRKMSEAADGKAIRKRIDVAMNALLAQEREGASLDERPQRRAGAAKDAACAWLTAQGERNGFALASATLIAYRVEVVPRGHRSPARMGIFDSVGLVEVSDPAAFAARVAAGFGRAKAFGCGLMLLRRAP